jgi:hypothetical protein
MDNSSYANYSLTASGDGQIKDWVKVIANYSLLSLSSPSTDKLVALAGVCRLYERVTGDALIAGLLKSTLPLSLLWERNQHAPSTRTSVVRYRAPSWSWASMDGPLGFNRSWCPLGESQDSAEILEHVGQACCWQRPSWTT